MKRNQNRFQNQIPVLQWTWFRYWISLFFFYQKWVWNQQNRFRVETEPENVIQKRVRVQYGSDSEPFRLQPYTKSSHISSPQLEIDKLKESSSTRNLESGSSIAAIARGCVTNFLKLHIGPHIEIIRTGPFKMNLIVFNDTPQHFSSKVVSPTNRLRTVIEM